MNKSNAYLIIYVMILTFLTLFVGLSVLATTTAYYTHSKDETYRQNVSYGANACAQVVRKKLTDDASFTGFTDQVIFDGLNDQNAKVFCTASVVADGSQRVADIVTTLQRYSYDAYPISYRVTVTYDSNTTNTNTTTDKAFIVGSDKLQVGKTTVLSAPSVSVGGLLWMDQNAQVGGNNIPITVANNSCTVGGVYPQHCSANNPITIASGATLKGKVCAPDQAYSYGISLPGLVSCSTPSVIMPPFNKKAFTDSMTSTVTGTSVTKSCIVGSGYSQRGAGNVTIPANTTVTGGLPLGSIGVFWGGGTCRITLKGDAYLTGDITVRNPSYQNMGIVTLALDDNVDHDVTVVIDGMFDLSQGMNIVPNAKGHSIHFVSFASTSSSCTKNASVPDDTTLTCLTATQAQNSAGTQAFLVRPYSAGLIDLSGATFYAYYGQIYIGGNVLKINAMAGVNVSLLPNGYITVTNSLGDVSFGGSGDSASTSEYEISDYTRQD